MADACNSCGNSDLSARVIPCQHCPTLICDRCRVRHESRCEEMQKIKARGQGATVRRVMTDAESEEFEPLAEIPKDVPDEI